VYGIQLWGAAKNYDIKTLQSFQSISLRLITNAPGYVSNLTFLHNDLKIPIITTLGSYTYKRFHNNTYNHNNPLISKLSSLTLPDNPQRRSALYI